MMLDFIIQNKTEQYFTTLKEKQEYIDIFFELFKEEFHNSYIQHGNIKQTKRSLAFSGTIFRFVWNGWNIFNPIAKGRLEFSTVGNLLKLNTKMYFTEFFVISALLSFASIPAFALGVGSYGILWLVFLWLIMYGGSRVISHMRMKSKISRISRKVNNPKLIERTLKDVWDEDKAFVSGVVSPFFHKNADG
ncbi:MAG: hypothetical protein U9N85_05840 [Bacteroidota bacterium]|nr:hypothetical protein [Bacteroidota bacterium]